MSEPLLKAAEQIAEGAFQLAAENSRLRKTNADLVAALEEIIKKGKTTGYSRAALGTIARGALAKVKDGIKNEEHDAKNY